MSPPPAVGILVGSESDLDVMARTTATLDELGVAYELQVASAHRQPELVAEYARGAAGRGLQVIICGAGLAAHLAGAVAAATDLPVIGVPLAGGVGNGLDALLSTVQMPSGIPVATVAVGKPGAVNAAVLAARIIALADAEVRSRLAAYRRRWAEAKPAGEGPRG